MGLQSRSLLLIIFINKTGTPYSKYFLFNFIIHERKVNWSSTRWRWFLHIFLKRFCILPSESLVNPTTPPFTHLSLDKMAAILTDANFKCIFLNGNDKIPIRISPRFVPKCPISNKASIGSGNGLASNRRQAITRTNACPVTDAYIRYFTETEMLSFWWNFHHWLH